MNKSFLEGFRDIAPMALAYAPIALLWGTVAAAQGLAPWQALLMSAWAYSGAAQFVSLDLMKQGMPAVMIVLTILTVSLRHVLMSASLSRHMLGISRGKSSVLLFWLTDEAWAMLERRALAGPLDAYYFLGVALPIWPVWFLFSALGAWLGEAVGNTAALGLDFAFAAMFIAVLAGFWKGWNTAMILVASAGAAVLSKLLLPGAWYIVVGGLCGMMAAFMTYREKGDEP